MQPITVYEFLVPDIREGDLVPARGKAPREVIESLYGLALEGTAEIVDAALINKQGRFHAPPSPGS